MATLCLIFGRRILLRGGLLRHRYSFCNTLKSTLASAQPYWRQKPLVQRRLSSLSVYLISKRNYKRYVVVRSILGAFPHIAGAVLTSRQACYSNVEWKFTNSTRHFTCTVQSGPYIQRYSTRKDSTKLSNWLRSRAIYVTLAPARCPRAYWQRQQENLRSVPVRAEEMKEICRLLPPGMQRY